MKDMAFKKMQNSNLKIHLTAVTTSQYKSRNSANLGLRKDHNLENFSHREICLKENLLSNLPYVSH